MNIESEKPEEFIICQICKQKVKRIYGKHLKFSHSNLSTKKYKEMFPGYPLQTISDKKAVSKNAGQFMKEEKWRKWASDKIKGTNNPMHHSKKTLQERKENSPFSKEFYKKRGLNEKDRLDFIKDALDGREFDTRTDYWIKRGYSEKEAIKIISKRQTTFSKEICIEKYGKEEGLKVWGDRQKKWKLKVFNEKTYIGNGSSKLSKNICESIIRKTGKKDFVSGKNEKFIFDKDKKRAFKYDITHLSNKKIIEINGIFWHCKPSLYKKSYVHPIRKMSAKEIWLYDTYKINLAEKYNYKVLTIWEDEYHKNPKETIDKCIDFLYE